MAEYTFTVEKTCPVCGQQTHATKMKARLITLGTDEDFCAHYKGVNPYRYRVWVCEHCGFAADEKQFVDEPLHPRDKEKIKELLEGHKINLHYTEERSVEDAIRAYKLGIYFAERLGWPLQKQAGYCMGMAWVYRDTDEREKENEMLRRAAELYEKSVMTEHYPINGMTDMMAVYMTGAAYYRLGDYEKATQILSQIMSDQEVRKNDAKLFERTRHLWMELREKKAAAEKADG
ncbi:DUF2225 domain-containing protein [Selenomonas sp. F0473]|uniref:DUF2225 domain-containing protein n=1 Tax=Selenomonas sp. F0473 TaxID=999423 RepID=UPI00029E359D|nr:DUF2225 domain-containing protein [Selenomonas sp. F0473]EKU70592.1 hypothetical protein HMPREF9161_01638 [Selenomonas sp. F0473]